MKRIKIVEDLGYELGLMDGNKDLTEEENDVTEEVEADE